MKQLSKIGMIALGALMMISTTSCKKDGVFHPKKKISTVYGSYSWSSSDPDEPPIIQPKTLEQVWQWGKKNLEKIELYASDGNKSGSIEFTYNKNNQVTQMATADGYTKFEFKYDGSKISQIRHLNGNILAVEYLFSHGKNKIRKIILNRYPTKEPQPSSDHPVNPDSNKLRALSLLFNL